MLTQASESGARKRLGVGKRIVFSILVTASAFAAAELLIACVWDPPVPSDPFVGFSAGVPLLVEQDAIDQQGKVTQRRYQINPVKRVWFNAQSFPAIKSPNTYRIVCLGGSTTFGRPFDDSTSFCGWLRLLLPKADPLRRWEVINAGGVSYASYRVARVMEEFADHDVDLFVLYTGQNEFLERRTYGELIESSDLPRVWSTLAAKTHLGQWIQSTVWQLRGQGPDASKQLLSGEVDEILNHSLGPASYHHDEPWHRGVEQHFRVNLDRMKRIADDAGARLAVVTPASNLRECSPFKAEFADSLDDPTRQRLEVQLQQARSWLKSGATEQALSLLETIDATDHRNADVYYLQGQALFRQSRYQEAETCFQLAIDHDVCPLRATSPIKDHLRRFIDDQHHTDQPVIGVDFESHLIAQLRQTAGHACFGSESFLDHVHPTIDGHREIAWVILQALGRAEIVASMPTPAQIDEVTELVKQSVDLRDQGVAFRNLAKVTHWAGKYEDATRHARDALRLMPRDLESRFVLADSLEQTGELDAAIDQYTELFEIGEFARACQPFGQLLAKQGHYDAAKAYLMQAILISEGGRQASAYRSLGELHQFLGETELAEECFENAEKVSASSP